MNVTRKVSQFASHILARWEGQQWLALLPICLLAFLLRVVFLDLRPPHFDEGINGWFVDQVWGNGYYDYDPSNYHGPLYFYLLLLAELILGRDIVSFRFMTALISTGIVGIVALHYRWFGRSAYWAAAALAVSPGMVFYGRYAIHESLLVLGLLLILYGGIRWHHERDRVALLCMAAGVVTSVATKETFIIHFGTWAIATLMAYCLTRFVIKHESWGPAEKLATSDSVSLAYSLKVLAGALVVLILLYTGFFQDSGGIGEIRSAVSNWFTTGTSQLSGHEKPFYYWLELLIHYEWPFMVALCAMPLLYWHPSLWSWRLGIAAFGILLAHSIIPYKTPWLVVSVFFLLAFVFGFLIDLCLQKLSRANALIAISLSSALLFLSLFKTLQLNFIDHTNFDEPYVYVHTSPDVKDLMANIESVVSMNPQHHNMRIAIPAPDPWPLPWLLGPYPGLSFTANSSADVIVTERNSATETERLIGEAYYKLPFQLRDMQQTRWVYYRRELFEIVPGVDSNQAAILVGPGSQDTGR